MHQKNLKKPDIICANSEHTACIQFQHSCPVCVTEQKHRPVATEAHHAADPAAATGEKALPAFAFVCVFVNAGCVLVTPVCRDDWFMNDA